MEFLLLCFQIIRYLCVVNNYSLLYAAAAIALCFLYVFFSFLFSFFFNVVKKFFFGLVGLCLSLFCYYQLTLKPPPGDIF